MSILISLLLGLLLPISVPAAQMVLEEEEYERLKAEAQGANAGSNGFNCIGDILGSISQSATNSYETYVEKNDLLMQQATTRLEHLKECRNELQNSWIEMEKAKADHAQLKNQVESKIKKSELAYKMKVLELEKQCRESANGEFSEYKKGIYGQNGGAIHDPTQLVDFNNRVNKQRKIFFDSCYRNDLNVKSIGLLGSSLSIDVKEIETELQNSQEALNSMEKQLAQIQKTTLQNCEDQEKLNNYHEALAARNVARAVNLNRKNSMFGMLTSVMSCVDPGALRSPTSNPDATSGTRPGGTSKTNF